MSDYATTNPATGEVLARFPETTDAEIEAALAASASAYQAWRRVPRAERAELLRRVATNYRDRADELAALLTLEMGKPITQAHGEVALSAAIYDYYAEHAETFLADEPLTISGTGTAVVRTEPIGPLLGVMPWNYPYYQVARFAAPNLALGNTILLKHAQICPQSALAVAEIFARAGAPESVYVNLFASNEQVARIIADPRVRGVSLTGSERAGAAVAEVAGRHLKKYVLELGGSDPFLVLDDAGLDKTVAAAVGNRMGNAGQACTASKRFIVLDEVYDTFLDAFVAAMREQRPGDPTDPATTFGPLSSQRAVDELARQVDEAVAQGATVATGGRRIERPGAWYEATVLTDVTPDMRAYREELFGPVAVVYRAPSVDAAVELANDSPYGLAAAVFSSDDRLAAEVADRLDTGMVWLNATSRSAPDLPFGGVKRSGVGRELSHYGIAEFANKKLIRDPRS
ncbi:MAG TPA: NAD-dependent succinate-semialdehyde dehydrogenase [Nocardia sp.]|uniref:NAD-dependent succinate-semialdehyde dehydrogenase n=1 Tax=Nocardia TaxID=1817 RepID=UPI002453B2FF|nr:MULTISPECIES: NAD-dependent succinate-semialdehyde dehydrogenase [Nocardia]HLS79213.1 NAD-dependent succinate-semialdehyde dehydrogenase [Nocardia sp.]